MVIFVSVFLVIVHQNVNHLFFTSSQCNDGLWLEIDGLADAMYVSIVLDVQIWNLPNTSLSELQVHNDIT